MKKILPILLLLALCCYSSRAQTNAPATPASWVDQAFPFLGHDALITAPYGIYSTDDHRWGLGIGIGYRVTTNVVTFLRLQKMDGGEATEPSGTIQLQFPINTKFGTIVPMAWTGVEVKFHEGTEPIGLVGIGTSLHLPDDWRKKSPFVPFSVL